MSSSQVINTNMVVPKLENWEERMMMMININKLRGIQINVNNHLIRPEMHVLPGILS